jgi:hypothetical protein
VVQIDNTMSGDALNPAQYSTNPVRRILRVDSVDSQTVLVVFDAPLDSGVSYEFTVTGVIAVATGLPMSTPFVTTFVALGVARAATPGLPNIPANLDLANPQTPRDGAEGELGTLQVDGTGDLANDSGRAQLRKRIFRRLSTRPGGFYHLDNYGLRVPAKRLLTADEQRQLELDSVFQVRQEPEVVAASATVTRLAIGTYVLNLRIQDNIGTFDMQFAEDPDA